MESAPKSMESTPKPIEPAPFPIAPGAFDIAMRFVIPEEGGYVDNPSDPGGATNYGISQAANPDIDVASLTLEQAEEIYRERYWIPAGCPELPAALACCHMDWAVNHGVVGAIETLRQVLGLPPGATWDETIPTAVRRTPEGKLVRTYLDKRTQWYNTIALSRPTLAVFLIGWLNRVRALRGYLQSRFPAIAQELN